MLGEGENGDAIGDRRCDAGVGPNKSKAAKEREQAQSEKGDTTTIVMKSQCQDMCL